MLGMGDTKPTPPTMTLRRIRFIGVSSDKLSP